MTLTNKIIKKLLLVLGIVVGFAVLAHAQSTPVVRQKQAKQTRRIHQGVASGELTPAESRKLSARQRHIQREKRRAKADGVVTPAERNHLRSEQRKANRDIYRQKHDLQGR